jgi:hypothetical protein
VKASESVKSSRKEIIETPKNVGFEAPKFRSNHEESNKWIDPKNSSCENGSTQLKILDKDTDLSSSSRLLSDVCFSKLSDIENMLAALRSERCTRCVEQNTPGTRSQRHEIAREKLSLEHKAMNIFLCKQMLNAARKVLLQIQMSPNASTLRDAKTFLHETLLEFHIKMEEIRCLQELESAALQSMQSSELMGETAPLVKVHFPFPNILDHLLECIPHID